MIESFSTKAVDSSSRVDYWNSLHSATFNGLVIDPADTHFAGVVRRWHLPKSTMIWPESSAATVQRRNAAAGGIARSGKLALHLLHEGTCTFSHRGLTDQLRQGDMVLFASEEYYRLDLSQHQMLVLELDRSELEGRVPDLDDHVARTIPRTSASTRLLHQFLTSFWREGGSNMDPHQAASYEHVMHELLVNSLNSSVPTSPQEADGIWDSARAIVAARFREQELTPADVADELGVSIRSLQYAAAKAGTTLVRHIQERRLEAAREMLVTLPDLSITRIAFECGFSNSAYFTRCFSDRFGKSPSAAR